MPLRYHHALLVLACLALATASYAASDKRAATTDVSTSKAPVETIASSAAEEPIFISPTDLPGERLPRLSPRQRNLRADIFCDCIQHHVCIASSCDVYSANHWCYEYPDGMGGCFCSQTGAC